MRLFDADAFWNTTPATTTNCTACMMKFFA